MSVDIKPPPAAFTMEFGGFAVVKKADWLMCHEKNVQISITLLRNAMKVINKLPRGNKQLVGIQTNGNTKAYIWKDENRTHIECLSEPNVSFNKKYQQLIKHLNSK